MKHWLSKSKYIRGLQCPRGLWLDVFEPHLARYSRETMQRFDRGRDFEATFKSRFEQAVDVSRLHGRQVDLYPATTAQLLAQEGDCTLFEAGFEADGVLVLADVVRRVQGGGLEVFEVKSGNHLTDTYVNDASVQYYVISSHFSVASFSVVHAAEGDGFEVVDLTDVLRTRRWQVRRNVDYMRQLLQHGEPRIACGEQCAMPYECPYRHHCALGVVQMGLFG